MYTKLHICNRALRLIRQTPISSLSDQTKEAEECNFLYPLVKQEIISGYPWKAARKKIILRSLYKEEDENNTFHYRFLLPFNCLKALSVNGSNSFNCNGIYLYAKAAAVKLFYIADIEEEFLTLGLAKLIALKLAEELAASLLGDMALLQSLENKFEIERKKAMQQDSIYGLTDPVFIPQPQVSSWIAARNT